MAKVTQEELATELKVVEVEGARRMQNAIIALLAMSGHMDIASKILALNPSKVCEGESIKENCTLARPTSTDLDRLKDLLDGWGVEYEAKEWEQKPTKYRPNLEQETYICVMTKEDQYAIGYPSFWTEFRFTPEGMFVGMGAWE